MEPTSQHDLLLESAKIGDEARKFIKTGIGRFLIKKMEDQITEALFNLKNADPHDFKEIMKYQNDIRVAECSKYFLIQAINEGFNALRELEEEEDLGFNNDLSDYEDQQQGEEEWQ